MKRRLFLKNVLGVSAAAAVTKLDAAVPTTEWQPKLYEYGKYGLLRLDFETVMPDKVNIETHRPENDWIIKREVIYKHNFGPFELKNTGVRETIYVPVDELTRVRVFLNDFLITDDYPEPVDGDMQFRPWDFIDGNNWGLI